MADPEYSICGYMTVYHYYAYPMNMRPRIRYFNFSPLLRLFVPKTGSKLVSSVRMTPYCIKYSITACPSPLWMPQYLVITCCFYTLFSTVLHLLFLHLKWPIYSFFFQITKLDTVIYSKIVKIYTFLFTKIGKIETVPHTKITYSLNKLFSVV